MSGENVCNVCRVEDPCACDGLTIRQWSMLGDANTLSLPGDGLRIKGAGKHRSAARLERLGFVRIARSVGWGNVGSYVYVTEKGRAFIEAKGPKKDRTANGKEHGR